MSSDLTNSLSEDSASRFSSQRFDSARYESVDDVEPTKDEGFSLIEWRRQNVIRLEEEERNENEMVKKIIAEADRYKEDYYKKWIVKLESSKAVNREKEKLFLESREKFHAEADKSYWKAVAELIPKEVPPIEKKGKKEKNASIVVFQGPKPGKPTDLSRMCQVLVKLKHKPSSHIMSLNAHTATVSK